MGSNRQSVPAHLIPPFMDNTRDSAGKFQVYHSVWERHIAMALFKKTNTLSCL
jgi:hypothetical protein